MSVRAWLMLLFSVGCGSGAGKTDANQAIRPNDAATPVAVAPAVLDKAVWPVLPALPAATTTAHKCGAFSDKAPTPIAVLNGRLQVLAPAGSGDIPRGYDVMSAPEPTDHESRLLLEAKGGEKFVVFVRELFQTEPVSSDEPMKYLADANELSADDGDFFAFQQGDNHGVVLRPKKVEARGEAVLLASAVIGGPGTPLKAVSYYVSPATFKRGAGCQDYAMQALAGTAVLGKPLRIGGGSETLAYNEQKLAIDVPKDFIFTNKQGPDFELYFVRKLAPLGRYPGHMLIYIGHHPDETPPKGSGPELAETGRLLDRDVSWIGHRGGTSAVLQTSVPVTDGGLTLQVIRYATLDEKFVDELLPIAQTLRHETAKAPR